MSENRAKEKLKAGQAVLVTFLNFHHASLAEYLGKLGFDVIVMDGEHNAISDAMVEEFAHVCNGVGTVPMLRLPVNETFLMVMQRYLGMGIRGYYAPHVQTVAQVHEIIDALKYPPIGHRGLGAGRATSYGLYEPGVSGWAEYMPKTNAQILIKISIEDRQGLAAIPEIVKIPEVDVIGIGFNDLAGDFGFPGQPKHPKVIEAVDRVLPALKASGKPYNLTSTNSADELREAFHRGERWLATQTFRLVRIGAAQLTTALKELQ